MGFTLLEINIYGETTRRWEWKCHLICVTEDRQARHIVYGNQEEGHCMGGDTRSAWLIWEEGGKMLEEGQWKM